jgi:hypothetical protein
MDGHVLSRRDLRLMFGLSPARDLLDPEVRVHVTLNSVWTSN